MQESVHKNIEVIGAKIKLASRDDEDEDEGYFWQKETVTWLTPLQPDADSPAGPLAITVSSRRCWSASNHRTCLTAGTVSQPAYSTKQSTTIMTNTLSMILAHMATSVTTLTSCFWPEHGDQWGVVRPLGDGSLARGSENAVSLKLNPVVIILKTNNESYNCEPE